MGKTWSAFGMHPPLNVEIGGGGGGGGGGGYRNEGRLAPPSYVGGEGKRSSFLILIDHRGPQTGPHENMDLGENPADIHF